jgi:hypothetical protein
MNERIQELFEQVADNFDPEDCMVSEEFLETFAELIVRECAAYAFSDDQDHKAMLNHFGVKQ